VGGVYGWDMSKKIAPARFVAEIVSITVILPKIATNLLPKKLNDGSLKKHLPPPLP
jgi:hypothetical protein